MKWEGNCFINMYCTFNLVHGDHGISSFFV